MNIRTPQQRLRSEKGSKQKRITRVYTNKKGITVKRIYYYIGKTLIKIEDYEC